MGSWIEMGILVLIHSAMLFGACLCEEIWYSTRGRSAWKSFGVSAFDFSARLAPFLFPALSGSSVTKVAARYSMLPVQEMSAWKYLLLIVGIDFAYYWQHRLWHGVRWGWASHAVHHSPNEFHLSLAMRFGLASLFGGWLSLSFYTAPFLLLGFPVAATQTAVFLHLSYQAWVHLEWVPKLGILEKVFVTPSHHRVHHSRHHECLDRNHGGILILFDKLFGTFHEERAGQEQYGLLRPQESFNPLRVELDPWLACFAAWFAPVRCVRRSSMRSSRRLLRETSRPVGWSDKMIYLGASCLFVTGCGMRQGSFTDWRHWLPWAPALRGGLT